MVLKKLLVPIDGSPNSFRALAMAASIAKPAGASITLVHAMYEPSHAGFGRAGSMTKKQKDEIARFVAKAESSLRKDGIAFKTRVMYGNTGYNILKMAHSRSEKFGMVVMGSRGRGAVREAFFGSTSNYVIHSCKIPVLVVK